MQFQLGHHLRDDTEQEQQPHQTAPRMVMAH
jgi:hypothetical protein